MMKFARAIITCLALAACTHAPSSEPVRTVVTETTVREINETVTPAMLVGRWSPSGDCANNIVMAADGALQSSANGAGRWALDGNMLTMTTGAGASTVWVGAIGSDELVFGQPDRRAEVWRRCPQ